VLVDKHRQQGFKYFLSRNLVDDLSFSLNFKQDLAVDNSLVTNIHFSHVWLAYIFDMQGGDRRITIKYRNPEAARSTQVFVAKQRQHC